ncbi:MAG: exosortase-associated EpsI family protein, partial [Fimbriiglobus sp.]
MVRAGLTISGMLAVLAAVGVANLGPTDSADALAVAARIATIPTVLGDWTAADAPIDPNQLRIAEADAHLSRTYTTGRTKQAVGVLLLSGRPGPLGAHTPDVCYEA